MTTLTADNLISEIIEEVSDLPHDQRVAVVDAYLQSIDEPERLRLQYVWPLHARDSQLPPTYPRPTPPTAPTPSCTPSPS